MNALAFTFRAAASAFAGETRRVALARSRARARKAESTGGERLTKLALSELAAKMERR